MTSKPEPQQAPLPSNSQNMRVSDPLAELSKLIELTHAPTTQDQDSLREGLKKLKEELLWLREEREHAPAMPDKKTVQLTDEELRLMEERLLKDPDELVRTMQELRRRLDQAKTKEQLQREHLAPAMPMPSGAMIYTVQKGANTVPNLLPFLASLTGRFGTRGR